jgi:N-acetylmuramoyl-L-alanine amidase
VTLGWAALAASLVLATAPGPASIFSTPPRVIINDIPVFFSVPPRMAHGMLIAPLAPLADAFHARVTWGGVSREMKVTASTGKIVRVLLPAAPIIPVMVPVAAFLGALGAHVQVVEGGRLVKAVSQVTDITWRPVNGALVARIATTGPVSAHAIMLEDPARLAVDITHAAVRVKNAKVDVGDAQVVAIRTGQLRSQPFVTRVVFDLARPLRHAIAVDREGIAVTFFRPPSAAAFSSSSNLPSTRKIFRPQAAHEAKQPGAVHTAGQRRFGGGPWSPRSSGWPATARQAAVIIDPGHGGSDSGAIGPTGLREADVTLAIARSAQQALERRGIRVTLTRTDDSSVGLLDRPDIARRDGGVALISIHANGSLNIARKGTETHYRTRESAHLARLIQSEVVRALGEPDRGIRTTDFHVITNTPMPAVLIETAFISNPDEEQLLRDPTVREQIAEAIARAVERFLGARTTALAR